MEHFSKALTVLSATLLLLAPLLMATDPDPLQDFCVADLNGTLSVNGYPCQPSSKAGHEFLFSTKLATGGDPTDTPNGSSVKKLDVSQWPGVNTLGMSMNRVDFAPGGINPPHIHPRATEVAVVIRGELLVGILGSLDSGNRYYSRVVRAGGTFVIPRGLMHFQFNVGEEQATMFVSFNSQKPGIVFVPLTLFGSSPPIPTPVLVRALRVDAEVVDLLKSKFAGGQLQIGPNLKPEPTQRVSWDAQDMKPGLVVMPTKSDGYDFTRWAELCVAHPTEPWIIRNEDPSNYYKFVVWNYHRLEKVHFHLAKKQRRLSKILTEDGDVSYDDDGLLLPGRPKFVSQKRWILVGSDDRYYSGQNIGYIYVYSYMAVRNFKGSKTYLVSKIKSFKAHDNGSVFLDVHPSRPYVLSISAISCGKLNTIKLWDWENGWDCVKAFNMEEAARRPPLFNPKDQDTFVTISKNGVVKVWNIDSPECKYTFPTASVTPRCFDFFTQGGKQYLIIVDQDEKCTIWDYHSGTLVETLKERTYNARSHPELPVLITGTRHEDNGRVLLWSSSTFSLVGVLNCDLGRVHGVSGVKGCGRIVINYEHGTAVAEIGHMLGSETPHESEGSEIGNT